MKVHKDWIGSKKPATKGDLADFQEDIHVDLQQFVTKQDLKNEVKKLATKEDLQETKGIIKTMKETMKTVLAIVKDIDRHNKENRDIPDRVTKLENDVFKLKLQR